MTAQNYPSLILASGSPRRRRIFEILQIPHQVFTGDVDERALTAASPREFALKAAYAKACSLDDRLPKGTIVIAADTIVTLGNDILFKPIDEAEAVSMLARLSGQTHQVITGVAVREVGHATQLDAVATHVTIRNLLQQEIRDYVETGEPLDKAGSYGIQGIGGTLVERVNGDYFNVVGLPISRLLDMLETHADVKEWRQRIPLLTSEVFAGI